MRESTSRMTPEINNLLTRTGPGTPMGDLFRRHWLPAVRSDELPHPDCPQLRLRLLGEELIVFRDTKGRVGILDQFCRHRRASLFFARNEECGLRCAYHGWKFDVDGNVVDIPSEPDFRDWREKPVIKSYPTVEAGGIVWAFMGPPDRQPPPPEYEFTLVPDSHRYVARRLQECNWLQGMEGGLDPVHVPFLHSDQVVRQNESGTSGPLKVFGETEDYAFESPWEFDGVPVDGGVIVAVRRKLADGRILWRISRCMLPCFSCAPPYGDDPILPSNAWVPRDDESLWRWNISCHPLRPLTQAELEAMRSGQGVFAVLDEETLRPVANRDNGYLIDRDAQRRGITFGGVKGVALQDQSIQESQGAVFDRAAEYLVASDRPLIKIRQQLLSSLQLLKESGELASVKPTAQRVRSATLVTSRELSIESMSRDILLTRPGVAVTAN